MSIWLYPYARKQTVYLDEFHDFVEKAKDEAYSLYTKILPEFWFDHASVFTRKQARKYNEMIGEIESFCDELKDLAFETQHMYWNKDEDYQPLINRVNSYRANTIEPLIDFFDRNRVDFSGFESNLEAVSKGNQDSLLYFGITLSHLSDEDAKAIRDVIAEVLQNKSNGS